jgi:hypothetical protein
MSDEEVLLVGGPAHGKTVPRVGKEIVVPVIDEHAAQKRHEWTNRFGLAKACADAYGVPWEGPNCPSAVAVYKYHRTLLGHWIAEFEGIRRYE